MAKTMPVRLLVIDQDARYGEWLKHHLGVICPDSPVGLMQLSDFNRWNEQLSGRDCDVLMLAASFGSSPEDPQAEGLELLRRLRDKQYFPAVIAVAEDGNELTAVRALQLGAVDYLPKRLLTAERLRTSIKLATRMIEKRVARRIASLAQTSDSDAKAAALQDDKTTTTDVRSSTSTRAALAARAASVAAATDAYSDPDATATAAHPAAQQEPASQGDQAGTAHEAPADDDASTNISPPENGAMLVLIDDASPIAHIDGAEATVDATAIPNPTAASTVAGDSNVASDPDSEWSAGVDPHNSLDTDPHKPGDPRQVADAGAPVPAARAPGGEFMPANFIPGYTIHATIGESEKAAVYVATNDLRGENVALKVSKTLRDEVAGRQFLEREYTAIVAIRDPAVVQIHDYGVHAGYEYLVMEYLPRGDLKARMQQGLTEQEAVLYVTQIAAALRVVHRAGLLHRDLKPPNVMLRENGNVALIDFGLARALDGTTASTRTGVLRGSPYYMSPEQALGEVLDARSDFYSLGVIFYEMLTGRKPYMGGSAMDVLQQHVNAPVPMLPKPLMRHEPVLLKLMAKARADRFASADEVLAALPAVNELPRIEVADDGDAVEWSVA